MTRIVFMGTPDFSVPVLDSLVENGYDVVGVVTQPDRPVGRKRELTPPPVKVAAMKHGIPVYQPEKIRIAEQLQPVLDMKPDLVVTAAFGQILPKELLETPSLGCINVHASLLPELRGGAPIHYSIIQGKEKTGITIMYMVEKLDAGDIITQVEVPIEERDHVGSLHDKLSVAGAKLLLETLPTIINGTSTRTVQVEEQVTFAYNIKREQEKIDWNKTGEEIYNHVRGLNPWPVAFTTLQDKVVKVWWTEKTKMETSSVPGTIVSIEKDGFVVATGNQTAIKMTELQPSGKKKMSGEDFLRGVNKEELVGTILGGTNE